MAQKDILLTSPIGERLLPLSFITIVFKYNEPKILTKLVSDKVH